jgi:hypothetical protein
LVELMALVPPAETVEQMVAVKPGAIRRVAVLVWQCGPAAACRSGCHDRPAAGFARW